MQIKISTTVEKVDVEDSVRNYTTDVKTTPQMCILCGSVIGAGGTFFMLSVLTS